MSRVPKGRIRDVKAAVNHVKYRELCNLPQGRSLDLLFYLSSMKGKGSNRGANDVLEIGCR